MILIHNTNTNNTNTNNTNTTLREAGHRSAAPSGPPAEQQNASTRCPYIITFVYVFYLFIIV